ncbi:MAG TPA: c-type cytochrome, partial [Puia sp.]|nr:c-type cytochrome [Puia sp.]
MQKILLPFLFLVSACTHRHSHADYPVYGGNKENNRYSPLQQINKTNVRQLQLAWTYNSADTGAAAAKREHEIQCQPIVVDGTLYGTNSTLKLFALDAATGKPRWQFDPFKNKKARVNQCRGITWWSDDNTDQRLFYAAGSDLWCVDAHSGTPVQSFGDSGKISLYTGLNLNHPVDGLYVTATSPGIIYKDILIIGSAVSESGDAAPGYLRAFNVRTGKLIWVFHTIPQPTEPGYETWPKQAYQYAGAVNNWSGLSLDEKRGLVFLGTGSPSADFYGGDRPGDNLYSDCILALDAATGKLRWYFQTIHHDLWDRDIPCPPNLTTIQYNGKPLDVLVQTTKDGLAYILDRDSGRSLFPIEERPVPTAGLPGEHPAPTQRYPQKPVPFAHQTITDTDLTNLSPQAHAFVKNIFDHSTNARTKPNKFLPPDTSVTLLVGYSGGAEWGGNAVDPDGILYQNSNDAPWLVKMISKQEREKQLAATLNTGKGLYAANCASCHGADRKGNHHEIPDLTTVGKRLRPADIAAILAHGQNRMPSFPQLLEQQRVAIIRYLLTDNNSPNTSGPNTPNTTRLTAGQAGVGMPRKASRMVNSNHPKSSARESATPARTSRTGPPSNRTGPPSNPFPYNPKYSASIWEKLTD